jgi:uncharacterized protein (DUF1778 family)
MSDKRDKTIGIRFTSKERELIEELAETRNCSLTGFIREAVFSHMNHLVNKGDEIDLEVLLTNFDRITDATRIINTSIDKLKKKLEIDDLINILSNYSESSEGIS